jgi:hypothetical protein
MTHDVKNQEYEVWNHIHIFTQLQVNIKLSYFDDCGDFFFVFQSYYLLVISNIQMMMIVMQMVCTEFGVDDQFSVLDM